jgi:hypothetical protein
LSADHSIIVNLKYGTKIPLKQSKNNTGINL